MKFKRILAFTGALLLFAMYACTLFFALTDHPDADRLLMASVICTFVFPVLLYGYMLVYRITRPDTDKKDETHST